MKSAEEDAKPRVTLVEQHVVKAGAEGYEEIDAASFAAKNLYNLGNDTLRQSFFDGGGFLSYNQLYHLLKEEEAYRALPRKVSQLVLKQVTQDWQSFFAAMRSWKRAPEKFLGKPKPPGYKHKQKGRCLLTYNDQAISRRWLQKGLVKPSGLNILVPTKQTHIKQVRIVPRREYYVVEVVYEREPEENDLDENLIAGIDLGIDNLLMQLAALLRPNQQGYQPIAVNGRGAKSINQFYNKRRARLMSQVGRGSTQRLRRLTQKRNRRLKHLMHTASRRVIDHLVDRNIGTLVIGHNPKWKQGVRIGRINNQKFVSIPHAMLLDMLTYKAQLAGMKVVLQEEGYTSKCSFLDGEYPQKREPYAGRRISRGMFRAGDGTLIHADVNGS